ncbi:putative S-adenosylmethionine-dependent methyltransferase superfamily domain-containing protein [Rosellinia necatrix]|uniref:type I protein arginine methyltransferase n=1 Tax=Rosellinia necatrix TaxID=77044 RepID=A0A1S8A516_ROSNE|nr:putative S-adenosylmethionine-dependent methyltransferase superfamily domain-containing protein [Rosellinia necatrix]
MAASSNPARPPRGGPASDSESDDSRDDEGWNDVEEDEEEMPEVISLLDDRVFPDVISMLAHCRDKHRFDFLGVRQRLRLDFHGCVRLVNFIRQRVHEGLPVSENISPADIDSDAYLKPVLDDDAVIIGLFDLPELSAPDTILPGQSSDNEALVNDLLKRNTELQEQLARVMLQHENYRAAVSKTLDERWGETGADDSASKSREVAGKGKAKDGGVEEKEDESKYYWESYAGVDIHETMLKDTVRTDAYRDFIYQNKHLFAGKTVLDIGCGTGILSMFCARAGAARVIAVDASDIIFKARENIYHANLSDTITTLHGKMEEVALPVEQVDIIVSEWMGYCLLFEAMLPSVLHARDRYLAPGGLMVPSHTNMWLAPVSDPVWVAENGEAFWADVYGFDMSAMAKGIYDEARVLHWPRDGVCGAPSAFKMLDLYTTTAADLSFAAPFASRLARDVGAVDGFLLWFDTFFSPVPPRQKQQQEEQEEKTSAHGVPDDADATRWVLDAAGNRDPDRVAFTTGPFGGAETHWKQGLLLCDPRRAGKKVGDVADVKQQQQEQEQEQEQPPRREEKKKKKDDEIRGDISFAVAEDNARALVIKMSWDEGRTEQAWALR